MSNYDDRNSTVRWIPRWARNLLGLTGEDTRPNYSRYDSDRREMAEKGVNWIPDPIQRWLGLDFSEPKRYGPSAYDEYQGSYRSTSNDPRPSLPPPPAALPPPPPRPAPGSSSTGFDSSQRPLNFNAGPRIEFGGYQPNTTPTNSDLGAGSRFNPDASVQPVGYLLRSYARGALPPQGLEEFTKQVRATSTDVLDFYTRWIRFQAEEVFRIGRDVADAVADATTPATPGTTGATVKRIKVTTVNGGVETPVADVAHTSVEPTPVPIVVSPATDEPVVPKIELPVAEDDSKDDQKPQG